MACIFCEIGAGRIPAQIVYSSADVTAFRDINPQAPTHVLIIPNQHVDSVAEIGPSDAPLISRLLEVANAVARQEGVADGGFRIVMNCGPDAGQTVLHLHLHLLGGRTMSWPPG